MEIESLKRWHWIVAGIVVGLALAYVWSSVEPNRGGRGDLQDLLAFLPIKDPQSGKPLIDSIVIHPVEEGANGPVNVVTYRKWMLDTKSKTKLAVPLWTAASVPFTVPGQARGANVAPDFTFEKQLKELQKQYPHVTYNNGWWTTKPATFAIWTAGSIAVIGGLWPTLLNVIVGAGYGHPRRAKAERDADEAYLARFKGEAKSEPAHAAKPAVSAAEHERLRAMTEQLESKLGGLGNVSPNAQPGGDGASASPVRKLDGGPLELTPAMSKPGDDDEIEVKGEYYPVLIHHKKHHDEPAEGAAKPKA